MMYGCSLTLIMVSNGTTLFYDPPLVSRMESLFVFFDIKAPKRVEQSAGFKIAALICVKFSLCLLRSPLRNLCCFGTFQGFKLPH